MDPLQDEVKAAQDAFEAEVKVAQDHRVERLKVIQDKYQKLIALIELGRHFRVPFNYDFKEHTFVAEPSHSGIAPVRS